MKRVSMLAIALMAGLVFTSNANAHNIGCGFGGWALKNPDTLVLQIFGVTLNGICGNQTFAITSGTLDCVPPKGFVNKEELFRFAAANMDNLAKDVAQGKGESLDALAEMMEVPSANRPLFGVTLQANFDVIFSKDGIEAGEVVDNIAGVAQSHHLI